jgi:hypothetical protein
MTNKTKFLVEIHMDGNANERLIRLITNHNSGKSVVTLEMLMQVFYGMYSEYPSITPVPHIEVLGLKNEELHFYEGEGAKRIHTLTIIEKQEVEPVYEGEETMEDIEGEDEGKIDLGTDEAPTAFLNTRNNLETSHY